MDKLALNMNHSLRLALYQPDMPPNTGAMMRLCACLGVGLDIIEPCGFAFDEKRLKRVVMDYAEHLECIRHRDWLAFAGQTGPRRVILLTTASETPYHRFEFKQDDILLVGRESAGVPPEAHQAAHARLRVPMQDGARSLNVGMAASIVLAEAIRQVKGFP
jgi:tRNA (cytidine/uridine-2'-O-)-methyltransferase